MFFSNPKNLLYGDFARNYELIRSPGLDSINGKFNYAEHTLFLNIVPMVLFLIGLFYLYKRIKNKSIVNYKLKKSKFYEKNPRKN